MKEKEKNPMNSPNTEHESPTFAAFEAFPEPRTIPGGWDVSELLTACASAPAAETDGTREAFHRLSA
jgi:hypothetical protein